MARNPIPLEPEAATGPRISPLAILVGSWLAETRRRFGLQIHDVTSSMRLNANYWRSIESGINPLPSDCAVGLTDPKGFAVSFAAASKLVAAVRYLDARRQASVPRTYDLATMSARADEILLVAPEYRPLIKWVQDQIARIRDIDFL